MKGIDKKGQMRRPMMGYNDVTTIEDEKRMDKVDSRSRGRIKEKEVFFVQKTRLRELLLQGKKEIRRESGPEKKK